MPLFLDFLEYLSVTPDFELKRYHILKIVICPVAFLVFLFILLLGYLISSFVKLIGLLLKIIINWLGEPIKKF